MALWARTQQLRGEGATRQIRETYGTRFPIEVRHYFAQWIEMQPWQELDDTNPVNEAQAKELLDGLIHLLEEKAATLNSDDTFLQKLKFQEIATNFRDRYDSNPLNLVRVIKNCLAIENKLVMMAEQDLFQAGIEDVKPSIMPENHRHYRQQFDFLSRATQETEQDLKTLQQKQESFILQYQESMKINAQIAELANQSMEALMRMRCEEKLKKQKQFTEQQLNLKVGELQTLRHTLAQKHFDTFKPLEDLKNRIIGEELRNWRHRQQKSGYGTEAEDQCSLDTIQHWCETLTDLVCQNRQQLKKMELIRNQLPMNPPSGQEDLLPKLMRTINNVLSSLVTSSFIIEKQPPQVLKKDSRFMASVRLLVGGKLNVHLSPPQVRASIISEAQARNLNVCSPGTTTENSGEILNNIGTMEYHQATGQLSVVFRNMQLKRIKRADRKGNEAVTEEKFAILFQSQFNIADKELGFSVWTLSAPVVVTVHGNQECNALATILWDNAFAEPQRIPFVVPDKVMWPQLAEALHFRFQSVTGRGLTEDGLVYLAQKLFGTTASDISAYVNYQVTWTLFNKEQLHGRNFTFWDWFYNILKLTKEYLKPHWVEGTVLGFVSKQSAQEYLSNQPDGTFLLRFSDSNVGGLTIAWAQDENNASGERRVWNLSPYHGKDFQMRSLADRIKDLDNLIYLWTPSSIVSKDVAFGKHWSENEVERPPVKKDDYVRSMLKDTISGVAPPSHPDRPSAPMSPYSNVQSPVCVQPTSPSGATAFSQGGIEMEDDIANYLNSIDEMDYGADDITQINISALLENYNHS